MSIKTLKKLLRGEQVRGKAAERGVEAILTTDLYEFFAASEIKDEKLRDRFIHLLQAGRDPKRELRGELVGTPLFTDEP